MRKSRSFSEGRIIPFSLKPKASVGFAKNIYNTYGSDGNYWKVEHVYFAKSFANARPTSTCLWFYEMKNLLDINDIENLNTSEVTIMASMFEDCFKNTNLLS